jgi:hypothetical protein
MADSNNNGGGSPFGCLGCIVTILVMWALLFGVTVGGKHYGVGCSCSEGVRVAP